MIEKGVRPNHQHPNIIVGQRTDAREILGSGNDGQQRHPRIANGREDPARSTDEGRRPSPTKQLATPSSVSSSNRLVESTHVARRSEQVDRNDNPPACLPRFASPVDHDPAAP